MASDGEDYPPASVQGVAHVGITVTDVEKAVSWYGKVLGFELLFGPVEVEVDDSHVGRQVRDIFGPRCQRFRQAHMLARNGIALEMFEFVEPATEPTDTFSYWRVGIFHLCLLASDIDALTARISRSGGRLRTSKIWEIFEREPYRTCYCEDPFGNIIELYSHPHLEVFGKRASY
jgi:catechol 2,3-dioxygenase-like lactoylglutathione lyase family enzyme